MLTNLLQSRTTKDQRAFITSVRNQMSEMDIFFPNLNNQAPYLETFQIFDKYKYNLSQCPILFLNALANFSPLSFYI